LPATPAAQVACTPLLPRGQPVPLQDLVPYTARFDRRWAIGSFSGLVRDLASPGAPVHSTFGNAAAHDDDPVDEPAALARAPARQSALLAAAGQPWHGFPRGALAGNFVHDQLEWLAHEGFALQDKPELQQHLQRRCERQGWLARAPDLQAWLAEAVATPLAPVGSTLRGVHQVMPEMEFWLPSTGLVAADVDTLCQQHILPGVARPALPQRELHGMLMGFADLVFEHAGRYWVLDYKSNHLGPHDASYTAAALHAAMGTHRYDVQAAIYLLALHRLLRARLGAAYQPEKQLGGALYFFLRGIHGPARGCVWVPAAPALLDGLDTLLGAAELPGPADGGAA
jgi:exodeoxyribonuclease V beta subunit